MRYLKKIKCEREEYIVDLKNTVKREKIMIL